MDFARETKGSHCPRCVWPYVFRGQGVDNAFVSLPNYWKHLFEDTPLCGAVDLVMKRNDIGDSYVFGCLSGSLRRSRYFSRALSGVRKAVSDGGAARGSMRIPAHRPPDGAASVANFRDAPPLRTTA
jgi:hypothetical protein